MLPACAARRSAKPHCTLPLLSKRSSHIDLGTGKVSSGNPTFQTLVTNVAGAPGTAFVFVRAPASTPTEIRVHTFKHWASAVSN